MAETKYGMYVRENETDEFVPVYGFPVSDTLPVGSVVQYNGTTVPAGWQVVTDTSTLTYIQKIAQPMATTNVINQTGAITLGTASFVTNTDTDYSDIPYMIELNISNMTPNDDARIYFNISAKETMECWSGFMQTLAGKLRMYWNSIPEADVEVDNILYQTII